MFTVRPALVAALLAASCGSPRGTPDAGAALLDVGPADRGVPDAGPLEPLAFGRDVWPRLDEDGCASGACHGLANPTNDGTGQLFSLASELVARAELERASFRSGRPLVVAGEPEASELVRHVRDEHVGQRRASPAIAALLERWVADGAALGPLAEVVERPEPDFCSWRDARGYPSLPSACLPRCSAETAEAYDACFAEPDIVACLDAVITADETPTAIIDTPTGFRELSCETCRAVHGGTDCFYEACPVETIAALRCGRVDLVSDCDELVARMDECIDAELAGLAACTDRRSRECFPPE